MTSDSYLEPADGVRMWIEQGSVHLKAIDELHGDPVELSERELVATIDALQTLLDRLRTGAAAE